MQRRHLGADDWGPVEPKASGRTPSWFQEEHAGHSSPGQLMTRDGGLLPSPHWTVYRQCVFAPTTRGVSRWVGDVLSATNAGAVWWGKGASPANHLTGILRYAGRQRHSMGLSRRPRGPRTRSRSDASIADFWLFSTDQPAVMTRCLRYPESTGLAAPIGGRSAAKPGGHPPSHLVSVSYT